MSQFNHTIILHVAVGEVKYVKCINVNKHHASVTTAVNIIIIKNIELYYLSILHVLSIYTVALLPTN